MKKLLPVPLKTGSQLLLLEPDAARREIPDDVSHEEAKACLLRVCKAEPIGLDWCGVVTTENVEQVAEQIRQLFEGRTFSIAAMMYADSRAPELRLDTNCVIEKVCWTDGGKDRVRVFDFGISFSTGGYSWSLRPAPAGTTDSQNFYWVWLSFERDLMTFRQRAPAGHLHCHCFKLQGS
jgi:hypothetical protein